MYCAEDGCMITAERHKEIYVYYHCSFGKGSHPFPYVREERVAEMLGLILKQISVPVDVARLIACINQNSEATEKAELQQTITRFQQRISTINARIGTAYDDRADGKITEDFWVKKKEEWNAEKGQLETDLRAAQKVTPENHGLTAERVLNLASRAHGIYASLTDQQRVKLLRAMVSRVVTDGVTIHPEYRQPFELIVPALADVNLNDAASIA
jgi:hypothetical protein